MAYQARIPSTTSPKARNSTGIHLVECTFGRVPTFVETDLVSSTESTVIGRLLEGQYERPRRIVAFDPVEGWAEDVSENVARALVKRAYEGRIILPRHTAEFCEQRVAGWFLSEVM
jgi:hypothetical protein